MKEEVERLAKTLYTKHVAQMNLQDDEYLEDDASNKYVLLDWAKLCLAILEIDKSLSIFGNGDKLENEIIPKLLKILSRNAAISLYLRAIRALCHLEEGELSIGHRRNYASTGRDVAKTYKNDMMENELDDVYEKLEDQLRRTYSHKVRYLEVNSLKDRVDGMSHHHMQTNITELLFSKSSIRKMKIEFKCDILTKRTFEDLHKVENSCKVLILNLSLVSEKGLLVEDGRLGSEYLQLNYLENVKDMDDYQEKNNIDIVILQNPVNKAQVDIVKEYLKLLSIKAFVSFDFSLMTISQDAQFDLRREYSCELLKNNFLLNFFENAQMIQEEVVDKTQMNVFDMITDRVMTNTIEDTNHEIHSYNYYSYEASSDLFVHQQLMEKLFDMKNVTVEDLRCDNEKSTEVVCSFIKHDSDGIIDISNENWKHKRSEVIYKNRNKDVVDIYKKMINSVHEECFLQLTGPEGCGKSFIAKQMAFELGTRNIFPDGVFYIDCGLAEKKYQGRIRELMGEVTKSTDLNRFFKHHIHSLMIFDKYSLIKQNGYNLTPPMQYIETMKRLGIKCVFVMHENHQIPNIYLPKCKLVHKVNPLSLEDCLNCLVSYGAQISNPGEKVFFKSGQNGANKIYRDPTFSQYCEKPQALMLHFDMIIDGVTANQEDGPLSPTKSMLESCILMGEQSEVVVQRRLSKGLASTPRMINLLRCDSEVEPDSAPYSLHKPQPTLTPSSFPGRHAAIAFDAVTDKCKVEYCNHCSRYVHK